MESSSGFNLSRLRAGLKPLRLYWFPRLRSTNDHAAELRRRGSLFAPAVVLTGNQTAGRGRGNNTWWSSADVLTVTFAFPIEEHLQPQQIPLVAGLAVRNAAAELAGGADIQLKWPNDVWHEGHKLAGLLCERVNKVDLIGVGLNVNLDPADAPRRLRDELTSLLAIAGKPLDMTDVLIAVTAHLRRAMQRRNEQSFEAFITDYERHHAITGRRVTVVGGGEEPHVSGRCEGIDSAGRLVLRDRGKIHHVIAGHVLLEK